MEQNETKQEQLSDKEIDKRIKEMESYIGENVDGAVSETIDKTITCWNEEQIELSFSKVYTDSKMTCIEDMYITLTSSDCNNNKIAIALNPRQAMQLAAVLNDISRRALIADVNYWKRQDNE